MGHQEVFHRFLIDQVRERDVDVVVIPGDIYDRAIPPVPAVRLLSRTLTEIAQHATVILTPGNHDSAARLGFGRELMRAGVHFLTDIAAIEHPVEVYDDFGVVQFYGVPYLEPDIMRYQLADGLDQPLARSHAAVTAAAMDRIRARIAAALPQPCGELACSEQASGSALRTVVLAHTFAAGGVGCDSERDVRVGGVDTVSAELFAGVDYVALGHLHGCQEVSVPASDTCIWYSGSPLPFSFSERNHRKCVLLVDLMADSVEVERIPTPVPRGMVELVGPLQDLVRRAAEHRDDWVHAVVTDSVRPPHLMESLRAIFPHLLLSEYRPEGRSEPTLAPVVSAAHSPLAIMDDFYDHMLGRAPSQAERDVLEESYRKARTYEI